MPVIFYKHKITLLCHLWSWSYIFLFIWQIILFLTFLVKITNTFSLNNLEIKHLFLCVTPLYKYIDFTNFTIERLLFNYRFKFSKPLKVWDRYKRSFKWYNASSSFMLHVYKNLGGIVNYLYYWFIIFITFVNPSFHSTSNFTINFRPCWLITLLFQYISWFTAVRMNP